MLISVIYILIFMSALRMAHVKCRNALYPRSNVARQIVSDNEVPWNISLKNYDPPEYNDPSIFNKPWSDPLTDNSVFKPKWNDVDGTINRKSFTGAYQIVNGRPLNPNGRTGIKGRGLLGRWGPNHAADPMVTRWKYLDSEKVYNQNTKLPVLQFCAIQRRDNKQWAIPGGMVDAGEEVTQTLRREFLEEAMSDLNTPEDNRQTNKKMIENLFSNGTPIYKGYVDDPRNTDNAWMETVAVNFHDETGETVGKLNLIAGDDAQNVRWMDLSKDIDLYANHAMFLEKVVKLRNAHW